MSSNLYDRITEQQNIYNSLLRKANRFRIMNDDKPSAQECTYLQAAADAKSKLIQLTSNTAGTGAERAAHRRDLDELDRRISDIKKELALIPKKPKTAPDDDKKDDTDKANNNKAAEKESDYDIDVKSWFPPEPPKHCFADVSGMEEVKKKLAGCVITDDLKELADCLRMKLLNSFLFVGPPGCGKTYITEAFIRELIDCYGYKYMRLNAADIVKKWAGEAEAIIKRVFEEAVSCAPVVVFIDEIDGICKNRSLPDLPEYAASITSSFLDNYNRINSVADKKIVFIGATNYPNRVDSAMIDRVEVVNVGLPDTGAREKAFTVALKDVLQLDSDITCAYMAEHTEGFNYRDIVRLTENIKKLFFNYFRTKISSSAAITPEEKETMKTECIKALHSGKVRLTRHLFDIQLAAFTPSNKSEIINDIEKWLGDIEFESELADDTDTDSDKIISAMLDGKVFYTVSADKKEYERDPDTGEVSVTLTVSSEAESLIIIYDSNPKKCDARADGRFVYTFVPAAGKSEHTLKIMDGAASWTAETVIRTVN